MFITIGNVFFANAERKFEPGILLSVTLIPICLRLSWTSRQMGSFVTATSMLKASVVSKPLANPASVKSCFAFARFV